MPLVSFMMENGGFLGNEAGPYMVDKETADQIHSLLELNCKEKLSQVPVPTEPMTHMERFKTTVTLEEIVGAMNRERQETGKVSLGLRASFTVAVKPHILDGPIAEQ